MRGCQHSSECARVHCACKPDGSRADPIAIEQGGPSRSSQNNAAPVASIQLSAPLLVCVLRLRPSSTVSGAAGVCCTCVRVPFALTIMSGVRKIAAAERFKEFSGRVRRWEKKCVPARQRDTRASTRLGPDRFADATAGAQVGEDGGCDRTCTVQVGCRRCAPQLRACAGADA